MNVHILGIGGTFMAGIALLARAAGHTVTGSDSALYPPMSTQLAEVGIEVADGFRVANLEPAPDEVVIGNALSRGNPEVEAVLDRGLAYTSGPAWLADNVLAGRQVLAVAGTHGKTTTASMLTHILRRAGYDPGWLIGGVAHNLGVSAALGGGRCFVVEADEYDTAFFDKRSKFIHYRPSICVLNNLEFDHADIFDNLEAIKRQFHQLVRVVPGSGHLVVNADEPELANVLDRGCWTPVARFNTETDWSARLDTETGAWQVSQATRVLADERWTLTGAHTASNALAAVVAADAAGVAPTASAQALADFHGVKRRLEYLGCAGGVSVTDDFAHHPTAIEATLAALADKPGTGRLIAVLQPASNAMRAGVHGDKLAASLTRADAVFVFADGLDWSVEATLGRAGLPYVDAATTVDALVMAVAAFVRPADHVVVLSNAGFDNFQQRLLGQLENNA
ncbi:UDP-N-acetylmuramate:L-alanyl-gamma-D-glutamyl-meso-diaminopimelate ligase [Salinisphaera sp. USBA-960]|nr:UDP-N-acetylmuramate:L-alanyl-gamma-D-glutamyl-meso-diaminopimelate ligase [Salifodinibacter halophilus]NNC26789.1 UDP-N-acetylmuramate:L-alanyl-gamma-D-glutamyl-meso-diaminopimelate ligase [Salifodinibacter halophilus]